MTLQEQIEARKAAARRKGYSTRSMTIAKAFGKSLDKHTHRFDDPPSGFAIESHLSYDEEAAGMSDVITVRGKVVFEDRGGRLLGYIPGDWEAMFETLYAQAVDVERKKADAEQLAYLEAERAEAARWGL